MFKMEFILFFMVGALFGQAVCRPDEDSGTNDIAGHRIPIERAPYMALVHQDEDPICGASIIHQQFVLTASHCCLHPLYELKVLVGAERIRDGIFLAIDQAVVHEKYNSTTKDYNVCLIKLRKALEFGPKVAKIALADKDLALPRGITLNSTEWGGYKISDPLMILQVEMPLEANERCGRMHKLDMTPRMLCAGTLDVNACPTGAGNPLTLGDVQVGLLSVGAVCYRPAIHTNVAAVGEWINDKIRELQ